MAFLCPAIISLEYVFCIISCCDCYVSLSCVWLQLFFRLSFSSNRLIFTVRVCGIRSNAEFFSRNGHMSSIKFKSLIYSFCRTILQSRSLVYSILYIACMFLCWLNFGTFDLILFFCFFLQLSFCLATWNQFEYKRTRCVDYLFAGICPVFFLFLVIILSICLPLDHARRVEI